MDKREMHWRRGHVFWGQGSECVFCFGDREESELIHFFVPFLLLGHSLVINSLVICHSYQFPSYMSFPCHYINHNNY